MKIYEYVSSSDGATFRVKEIEAEEKEKTYKITSRGCWRNIIKKNEMGRILDAYCLNMYLAERDDEKYINAVIAYQERKVARAREKLDLEERTLANYKKRLVKEAAE